MLLFGSTPTWFFIGAFIIIILFIAVSEFLTRK